MSKLSEIFGGKDDDADEQSDVQPDDGTEAAAQPQGDETHPPAAMPNEPAAAETPSDEVSSSYSSMEEYEQSLPEPDALN